MRGAHAIVQTLLEEKVEHIFGFPGGAVIPLYDELLEHQKEVRHILVRHEQGAAHAADAYARILNRPGVCVATSGPGATNLVTGIMTAYMDSSPVIAFGGQVPTSLIGNDAFQESDMMGITLPITKHNYQLRDPNKIRSTIKKAFTIAVSRRPGPIYIDLPKDVQTKEVTNEERDFTIRGFKPIVKGHPKQIKMSAELILKAERPLLLVGGGARLSNATDEIMQLSEKLLIPTTTTFMGKSTVPENHPLCLGVLGMHGRKVANYAITSADLIIAIGIRFNDRITGNLETFAKDAKIIHIDIDSAEIGKNVKPFLPIVGDAKEILKELLVVLNKMKLKKNTVWAEKIKKLNKECRCNSDIDSRPIDPRKLLHEMNKIVGESDIVATGVGQQQMYASHFLKRTKPRTFISSGGAGTMGFGLPASIGAKVAKPDAEVFDFDGDGSFAMNIQELGTSKVENIKVIPVIMNNAYLGMVRQWLEIFFEKRYSQVFLERIPDFAMIADSYGLNGITVTRPTEIGAALKEAVKNDETTVIDVHVAKEANILPMFAAGADIIDMFGWCIPKGYFKK